MKQYKTLNQTELKDVVGGRVVIVPSSVSIQIALWIAKQFTK